VIICSQDEIGLSCGGKGFSQFEFVLHVIHSQGKYAGRDDDKYDDDCEASEIDMQETWVRGFMDKRDQSRLWIIGALLPLIGAVTAGCLQIPQQAGSSQTASITEGEAAFAILAGSWEYEEGAAVVPLEIDRSGVGTYPYKGGQLITDSLDDHHWRGRWHQAENDREGGFEVTLAPDLSEGDGRWWYTRIGRDQSPTETGGVFHLTRSEPSPDPPPAMTAR
jgi:hypothetical protein